MAASPRYTLVVDLDEELHRKLEDVARKTYRTKSEIIRELIRNVRAAD